MNRKELAIAVVVLVGLQAAARAADWPQFLGPKGTGTATDKGQPAKWSTDKNIGWKVKLPGYGWSSPIVLGDKVFVTTAVSDKQRKPTGMGGGFGGGGRGFGGGRGGPGGPGRFTPPQPGQILLPFLRDSLELTDSQKKKLDDLQKQVDGTLAKILTDEQKKELKEPRGGRGGRGGFGGFPQPGQILPSAVQERLKLSDSQKKQLVELQKQVDGGLAKILTEAQAKKLKEGPQGFGRGGRGGRGGFGGRAPDAVYKWEVYCLNAADGKVVWKRTAAEKKPATGVSGFNTYATETPVTDGKRLYAYFGMTGVFCYDLDGKKLWSKDLGAYRTAMGHGSGSSPAVDDQRLYVQCDNEEKSFLVALDKKTGEELWRTARKERTGWSTPLVWKNKKRTEIVCLGVPTARSYDPATGKQLWELSGMTGQCKASPVASAKLLYVGTGGGFGGGAGEFGGGGRGGRGGRGGFGAGNKPLFAIKAGASGDITLKPGAKSNDGVAWYQAQGGPSTASPLLYKGHLYVVAERGGVLTCFDAKTGKQIYKERLTGARGITSSPWACDGKIYCLTDDGVTFVVQAGAEFKLLGKNDLNGMCWASTAVGDGSLFLRTVDFLYCIKDKK